MLHEFAKQGKEEARLMVESNALNLLMNFIKVEQAGSGGAAPAVAAQPQN